ncbi:MAG: hypothetical protein U0Q16_33615 [Bryobacteraceae bacterium]
MALLVAPWLAAEPKIVFSKSFPGSKPPLVFIEFERNGKAVYKEAENDEQPIPFELTKEQADQIFALAEKLGKFNRPLESGLKVANMGQKSFRWDDDGKRGAEVKFNYSQDEDARSILDWFEKMIETEQHFINVERSVKFDKLGANRALLLLQAGMERDRLVGLTQFLPLLERVTKNQGFLHMDRERATTLIEWIKNGKPKADQ